MGLSSSKSKTTTDQKTSERGTTTPVNPPWVTDAISEYTSRLGAFGDMDPASFVAPSSPLQNMAWGEARSLGNWQGQNGLASGLAGRIAASPANLVGDPATYNPASGQAAAYQASQYQAPTLGSAAQAAGTGYQAPVLGPAALASAHGYDAPTLGSAHSYQAQGYQAPALGSAQTYAGARVGQPIGAFSQSYAPQPVARTQIGPAQTAAAADATAASGADYMSRYQNPFTQQVVDTTLAGYDRSAAETRARMAAQAARAGAFGGSRYGIAEGQFAADTALGRAATEAQLRSQGFDTAAGLGQQDAANAQGASQFNAGNRTNMNLANSAAANQAAALQAQLDQAGGLFNATQATDAARFGAESRERAGMLNVQQDLQARLAQAGFDQSAGQFNAEAINQREAQRAAMAADAGRYWADAQNQAGQFGAAANNQYGLTQAQLQAAAAEFGAGSRNQANIANQQAQNQVAQAQAGLQADAAQYGASAANSTSVANQQANNQFALQQAALLAEAGQYNTGALNAAAQSNVAGQNDFGLDYLRRADAAGQYGAGAWNEAMRFNAGQGDAADARALQAAGLLGQLGDSYGSNQRADLATMAQLGDQQRGIEQAYALAPLAQLQSLGQLYGTTPYNLFSGQNVQSNETMNGTNVTTQTPSLFNQLLAAGQVASSFVKPF